MKIVVLGGSGEVGRAVTADLAGCRDIDEIIVADISSDAAAFVALLDDDRVNAAIVDLNDTRAVLRTLEGADVLMNCTSFTVFDRVLELAIEARVDYADLMSFPSTCQRKAVEGAGITAISGLGSSPGLSNVLVRHSAEEFDEIEEVHISGVSWRAIARSQGLLDTVLWELAAENPKRRYFQNGRLRQAGFMEGSRTVEFAPPVGRHLVYLVPHPEPVTLPRHFPTLKFCAVRVGWQRELMEDIRVLNKYGLLQREVLAGAGEGQSAFDATYSQIWRTFGGCSFEGICLLFTHVEVIGQRNGTTYQRVYDLTHPLDWGEAATGRQTGICASVGAQLLARHGRTTVGFVDPEVYYDPHEFIAELKARGTLSLIARESVIERGSGCDRAMTTEP